MIVFCEDCGERYSLEIKNIKGNLHSFKCRVCGHLITISKENPSDVIPLASALLAQAKDKKSNNKEKIPRVLIVDDSKFFRRIFTQILEADGTVEVVGEAANGHEALSLIDSLKPDLITLDVNMPVMGGTTALKRLMLTHPCPVVIISNLGNRTEGTIIDFLRIGAMDFLLKPKNGQDPEKIRQQFVRTIHRAAYAQIGEFKRLRSPKPVLTQVKPAGHGAPCRQLAIILSGAGGYVELFKVFHRLPSGFDGTIVLLQTMPEELTTPLVAYINQISRIPVLPIGTDTQLLSGHCYIGTNNIPLELQKRKDRFYLKSLSTSITSAPERSCSDLILRSVTEQFSGPLSLTLLSGAHLGSLEELEYFRTRNGKIIIQKPSTCMVIEQIEEVEQLGLADTIAVPEEIVEVIIQQLNLSCVALAKNKNNRIGTDFSQKRRFQRIFFTLVTGPRVYLTVSDESLGGIIAAVVVNLSESGLGLVVDGNRYPLLPQKGQQMTIKNISGDTGLDVLTGEKVEVAWILDKPLNANNGMGCLLVDIPDTTRQFLKKIVDVALLVHKDGLSTL